MGVASIGLIIQRCLEGLLTQLEGESGPGWKFVWRQNGTVQLVQSSKSINGTLQLVQGSKSLGEIHDSPEHTNNLLNKTVI